MQQDPMQAGKDTYPPDEEWQERRNGSDPFEGTQPWTQVSGRDMGQDSSSRRSRSIPPTFMGGNKYQSPDADTLRAPAAQPARPNQRRKSPRNPYQTPGGNPYQAPQPQAAPQNPYRAPVRNPYQAPYQAPSQNPYQAAPQNPYQAPQPQAGPQNPYRAPAQNPYQAPPFQAGPQNPYQSPVQNPYQSPQPQAAPQNPYQAPAQNPYQSPQPQAAPQNPYQAPAQNPYQSPQLQAAPQNPYQAPQPQAGPQDPYQAPSQNAYQALPPQAPSQNAYQAPAQGGTDQAAPDPLAPPPTAPGGGGTDSEPPKTPVKPAPPTGPRATPPTGVRPRPVSRAVYVVLTAVVVVLAVAAVVLILRGSPQNYAYVQAGTLSTVFRGDAMIVRNETIYTQEGVSRIDYIAEEGAAVQRAENVCLVYSSGFSEKELTTLENYRRQIKEYHKILVASSATKDVQLERLEGEVLSAASEIQSMVQDGRGSLVAQEKVLTEAMQTRQLYLKQKYPDDQKLARLYDDENTQLQRISSWTKQYAAAAGGLVSFYTDGYENALNLNNYANYTPTEVRAMFRGSIPEQTGYTHNTVAVYRLVRQGSWVVLMLCENRDWVPVEGRAYKMLLEGFESTVVNATVESFTRSGGELLLRLRISGDIDIGSILYMRTCSVMIGESVDSLMVPHKALYTRQGRIGVVIATESGEYWTAVEVVSDDGVTAHIVPENAGILYEGVPVLLF